MSDPTPSPLLGARRPPVLAGWAAAAGSVAAITALIYALREIAPIASLAIVYLLAVIAVATFFGRALGIATAVLSALTFNYFHVEPTGTFTIADGENWVALAIFAVTAIAMGTLADLVRARARDAEQRRREADLAAGLSRLLLGSTGVEAALPAVEAELAQAIGVPSAVLVLNEAHGDAQHTAFVLDLGTGRRPATLLLPAALDPETQARVEARLIPPLTAVLTAALDRETLEREVVETRALRRSDDLKTAILRAVSHDLRSPLTSIITSADALASPALQEDERAGLVAAVGEDARRLTRLVDQLLDLSRLQAGSAEPRPDWVSIPELVTEALRAIGARDGEFEERIDPDVPLVQADAGQLERALANLLENARQHSGGHPVSIRARAVGSRLVLRIVDRGPGIPERERERVFEAFYRRPDSSSGGAGLGLAVARGFIEANGGRVLAESLPGQGSTFVVEFPL
ncbi:MAG: DUF4118 domain-containing protein [Solirubrobacteraceae bacterium]|nr:DUF4118 domain-containing protein [Solirubrobacteraceae bacterium]